MTTIEINRILLADDGSGAAGPARRTAIALAEQSHAKLSIVYVLEPLETEEDGRRIVREAAQIAEKKGIAYDVLLASPVGISSPGRRILAVAADIGADLIVLGARGLGGVGRVLLGSVSSYTVHHATCSVLVAR